MTALNYPLSNAQLELLKLFANDVPDEELIEIKRLIVKYYVKKLEAKAAKVWEEKNWMDEDMDRLLNTHMRTPYKKIYIQKLNNLFFGITQKISPEITRENPSAILKMVGGFFLVRTID